MHLKPYSILLYYCYTTIDDPATFREQHHLYCIEHQLRGRIIIAQEGINGTVSGRQQDCAQYMANLKQDPRFIHTHFKHHPHHRHAFQKLHVRVKPEIVHMGLPHINPIEKTRKYVTPAALKKMKANEDVVLLDVRSSYEHRIGKFKNAVTLDLTNFRDFPKQVNKLAAYRDKKIVTYCTGGIRCEKASAYLLQQGFKNVYQLHGGIIQYGLTTDGEDFEGTCYVFDNRLTVPVNTKNTSVVGQCHICNTPCDRMVNCANPACNLHVPICKPCGKTLDGACSEACQKHPKKRKYNDMGYYAKNMNGYNPYKGLHRKMKKVLV